MDTGEKRQQQKNQTTSYFLTLDKMKPIENRVIKAIAIKEEFQKTSDSVIPQQILENIYPVYRLILDPKTVWKTPSHKKTAFALYDGFLNAIRRKWIQGVYKRDDRHIFHALELAGMNPQW